MLTVFPIPAFTDNYIWLFQSPETNLAYVVDPGDAAPVLAYLKAQKLQLGGILITHHHWDHTGGIGELLSHFNVPVYGPKSENIPQITKALQHGDSCVIDNQLTFSILEVPGHTLDHIVYYLEESEAPLVFCGDTLFAAGCGRLFEGTPAQMHKSLASLAKLPAETRVCCTHEYTLANLAFAKAVEPNNDLLHKRIIDDQASRDANRPTLPSTIGLELATNPFMRSDILAVKQAAENHCGSSCNTEVEVLAAVRGWKDNF
jgi:hydroxyacylglutathione hydrolase